MVAAVVLVAGLVAGCGGRTGEVSPGRGPSSPARPGAAARREYVACTQVFCTGRGQMKPRPTMMTPSGDGSLYVTGITWQGWGTGTATGTGTAHADNCNPNCAQGTYHQYPGTITLTSPKPWRGKMAYSRETVSVPAIQDRVTFRTGLLPGRSSPPVVTPQPAPGPVSSGATLTGSCVMGYEPACNAGGATVAYGPFKAGAPVAYTKIASTDCTPAVAYQVTLTNSGTTTAQVTGRRPAARSWNGTAADEREHVTRAARHQHLALPASLQLQANRSPAWLFMFPPPRHARICREEVRHATAPLRVESLRLRQHPPAPDHLIHEVMFPRFPRDSAGRFTALTVMQGLGDHLSQSPNPVD